MLMTLAEHLGKFVPLVGGASFAPCLLETLATLAQVEETVVRDKAVESLQAVFSALDGPSTVAHTLPIVQTLVTAEWFTARVSAAGLFAAAYAPLLPTTASPTAATAAPPHAEARATLRALFSTLCGDETPMVRRAAARALAPLSRVYEREHVCGELLAHFLALATDEQESVRLLALEGGATPLSAALPPPERTTRLLPLLKACAGDKSWKVRNAVAREFLPLSSDLGGVCAGEHLLPPFSRLLRDPEGEVRASAARSAPGYLPLVGWARFSGELLPPLCDGVVDPLLPVRVACATALMTLAVANSGGAGGGGGAHVSTPHAVQSILPSILMALRDGGAEVRLAVLQSLAAAAPVFGGEVADTHLVPLLAELAQDRMWRVRDCVISQLPLLTQSIVSS